MLHTAVDVAEPGSGQHVGRLLVDQSVEVSLDLENVRDRKEGGGRGGAQNPIQACFVNQWYLW